MQCYLNLSDRLQKLALNYGFRVWLTYPGNVTDMFTHNRGRSHCSKSRNVIYCCFCDCGVQYVGESMRNLKVRLNEHLHISSSSSFSQHLRANTDHTPIFKDTMILASESNMLKRKMMESACITSKKKKVCNAGPSIELSSLWQVLTESVAAQMSYSD